MIIASFFGVLGLACGQYLRLVAFLIFLLISIAGYCGFGLWNGIAFSVLALDCLIAFVSAQIGYFFAVLIRVALFKREKHSVAAAEGEADDEEPATSGGKPLPR